MEGLSRIIFYLIIALIVVSFGFYFFNTDNESSKPKMNSTPEESSQKINEPNTKSDREVKVTNGKKHTVPLDEIISGGPSKDGIPSIDNPNFISPDKASNWLSDSEPGISVSIDGVDKFYPYQILVWHEIVNDKINDKRILVTYCPLCLTGFVFDPLVKGDRVEFGVSGRLWKSNLVMYDRKTDSLWSQVLGESIVGEMAGIELEKIPSDQIRFGEWKENNPGGLVLSRDTQASKSYGSSPYGDYFSVTDLSLSLTNPDDDRLPNDAFVFGIELDGKAKAYSIESVKEKGEVRDQFQGETFVLKYKKDSDVVRMYKEKEDGTLERQAPVSGFWFSWVAAHPDTKLFK